MQVRPEETHCEDCDLIPRLHEGHSGQLPRRQRRACRHQRLPNPPITNSPCEAKIWKLTQRRGTRIGSSFCRSATSTYLIFGLAVVYLRLHATRGSVPVPALTFLWPRLAAVSGGFLIAAYTFVRMFVSWR